MYIYPGKITHLYIHVYIVARACRVPKRQGINKIIHAISSRWQCASCGAVLCFSLSAAIRINFSENWPKSKRFSLFNFVHSAFSSIIRCFHFFPSGNNTVNLGFFFSWLVLSDWIYVLFIFFRRRSSAKADFAVVLHSPVCEIFEISRM